MGARVRGGVLTFETRGWGVGEARFEGAEAAYMPSILDRFPSIIMYVEGGSSFLCICICF